MPRLIFVNRFFHPDISATSQLLSQLAFSLAADGWNVEVVTSRMRYDDRHCKLSARETVNSVFVHRVPTSRLGRGRARLRVIDYLTFYASTCWFLLRHLRAGDQLILKTDPPMLSVPVVLLARLKRVRVINWYQDVFPEIAYAAGFTIGRPRINEGIRRILFGMRDWSLRNSTMTVVLGTAMQQHLKEHGIPEEQMVIIPNWTDTAAIVPISPQNNELRHEWGLDEHFVVAYSGNMGIAHEFEAIIDAAEILRDDPRIRFLIIGGGFRIPFLQVETERRGLQDNLLFKPYQPYEQLSQSLGTANIHLVSLRPSMEGLILPSKFYGIAAAARPTIFIGNTRGEMATLLEEHECGASVENSDGRGLVNLILDYANDPQRCQLEGNRARQLAEAHYNAQNAKHAWEKLLKVTSEPS